MNTRLIMAILSNSLIEAIIVSVILWGLPRLGINIPLYGLILICVAFLIYALLSYNMGSRTLRKKPLPGFTSMVGIEGQVVSRLAPEGLVRIEGELWNARGENGPIDAGTDVVVVSQSGLKVVVRPKQRDNPSDLENPS